MTIESVTKLENRKNTYIAALDNGATIKLTLEQVVLFQIYAGQEISDEEFERLCLEIDLNTTRARAIRALGNGNLSANELKRRLVRKGASSEAYRSS